MRTAAALLLAMLTLTVACGPTSPPGPTVPEVFRDIVYTENPSDTSLQSLDVYTPDSGGSLPVMVFVHGGGWQTGDKANAGEKPEFFQGAGYVYVSVNYRLSPEVVHPVHVSDVAEAIAWVYRNIVRYGGDPERIFLMGHSAGAHLAALVATDESYLESSGCPLEILRGVVLLDGAGYNLPAVHQYNPSLWSPIYAIPFTDNPDTWADASPVNHVAASKDIPPFLIIYVADRTWSKLMSNQFGEKLNEAGVPAEVVAAENKTHATLNQELGVPGDEITATVMAFLAGLA